MIKSEGMVGEFAESVQKAGPSDKVMFKIPILVVFYV